MRPTSYLGELSGEGGIKRGRANHSERKVHVRRTLANSLPNSLIQSAAFVGNSQQVECLYAKQYNCLATPKIV